ncbi:hypothetical protein JWG45_18740 [Leptospira sp. 201903070]|uniref:Uncharacterized protein n=1 Tax=Leptospira ainlahdjerensis TaxID=2810033 RepID=A0ABS2UJB1_9LEPT|nr:hypothetical protein [Leptospira ainlahdjerensis]MBM9579185.1 hypothetical protein [Leptospira ainlahdjerensis]
MGIPRSIKTGPTPFNGAGKLRLGTPILAVHIGAPNLSNQTSSLFDFLVLRNRGESLPLPIF